MSPSESLLEPKIETLDINNAPEDGQKTPHAELQEIQGATCPFSGQSMPSGSDSAKSCPVSGFTPPTNDSIQEVDPELLRTSLEDRMVYLTDFLHFGRADIAIISKVGPMVHDMIPEVVDRLYANLFQFDITKQVCGLYFYSSYCRTNV